MAHLPAMLLPLGQLAVPAAGPGRQAMLRSCQDSLSESVLAGLLIVLVLWQRQFDQAANPAAGAVGVCVFSDAALVANCRA